MAKDEAYKKAEKKIEKARSSGAKALRFDRMGLTEIPESLWEVTQLQRLNLSSNQLTKLPEKLRQLTQLQELDVSSNTLTELPESLGQLTKLVWLNLKRNKLAELTESLGQCTKLVTLYVSDNQLTALPDSLGKLTQLEVLEANINQLTMLPESLDQCTKMLRLYVGRTHIGKIPDRVAKLKQLESLYAFTTGLTDLPDWIGELKTLTRIDVSGNNLIDVPISILQLPNLKELNLGDDTDGPNPLNPELAAAYEEGLDAVKAYLRAKADGEQIILNEAKLILIGEGEVGKSCLLDALRGEPFQEHDSTHGIQLAQVEVTEPENETLITLNGWDFGGQKVYRPTHQLFFSAPAVYLVVWKPREGQQAGQVKEWIKLVKHREPDAKIIVVATHGGPRERQPDIDKFEITSQFGHDTVVDFHWVDSKPSNYDKDDKSTWTGPRLGIPELNDAIARIAAALPEVGRRVPGKWQGLWKELEGSKRSWMPWEEFRSFCVDGKREGKKSEGTKIDADQFDLFARLSHTLGHLIHYDYDSALKQIVILKPDWLATAISFVFDDKETRDKHGLVKLGRLNHLWNDPERKEEERYPIELHKAFLKLMDRFDLSYEVELPEKEVAEDDRTILIAQLVKDTRPESFPEWDAEPAEGDLEQVQICRIVDEQGQSALAEGLFYQLIVRLHKYSLGRENYEDSVHWQRGLMLDDNYNGRALLEHTGNDVHITVRAAFPEWFLSVLTREVKWLVESFWEGLRCEVTVPCTEPCGKGRPGTGLFEVEKLVASRKKNRPEYPCEVSGCEEWQDIDCLLRNAPSTHTPPDAIINASFEEVSEQLTGVRDAIINKVDKGFSEADRRALNRFRVLEAGQKRLMSMIDEQFDGLIRSLTDEAKEGPRLFSFAPVEKTNKRSFLKRVKGVGRQEYQLTLWCEHARLPLTAINAEGDDRGVYTLSLPNKWLVNGASFLSKLNTVLGLVLPVAGAGMKMVIPDEVYQEVRKTLEFKREIAASLVNAGDTVGSLMTASNTPGVNISDGVPGAMRRRILEAEGSTLRELHGFLNKKDKGKAKEKHFGGLVRVQNKQREFLWVHESFVDEY